MIVNRSDYKVLLILLFLALNHSLLSQDTSKVKVSFRDSLDGAFDMSDFLLKHQGVLPVPMLITEPAIGYGGGLSILYFHKRKYKYGQRIPPSISGIGGLATENGSWGAAFFHFHVFNEDKVRTYTIIGKPDINIDFYGLNNDFLRKYPVELNMNSSLFMQRFMFRLSETNFWGGLSYFYYRTENSIDTLPDKFLVNKILKKLHGVSIVSAIRPMINYDSRDNIFSPKEGIDAGVIYSYNAKWLGSDKEYSKFNTYLKWYYPLCESVFSAFKIEGDFLVGEAPAYTYPFIQMRAVPAMRYQNENVFTAETEWRFCINRRWSGVGFTGIGSAYESISTISESSWIYSYGAGFRYLIARALDLQSGLDFAWAKDNGFAFYIVFGSYWGN